MVGSQPAWRKTHAGGKADVGVLLHDLDPGTRLREPALDNCRALVPRVARTTKTVKDVPGRNVRDVLGLDKKPQGRATHRIFHDLRRTAARNMVSAGVAPQVAMRITGHRTDAMFRRYAIVDENQKRQALARTQNYLQRTGERRIVSMPRKETWGQ